VAEDRVWYCKNCDCEFDIDGEGIRIVKWDTSNSVCIFDAEGRAHNLRFVEWSTVQAHRHCTDFSLSPVPSTLSEIKEEEKKDDETEVEATETKEDFMQE